MNNDCSVKNGDLTKIVRLTSQRCLDVTYDRLRYIGDIWIPIISYKKNGLRATHWSGRWSCPLSKFSRRPKAIAPCPTSLSQENSLKKCGRRSYWANQAMAYL